MTDDTTPDAFSDGAFALPTPPASVRSQAVSRTTPTSTVPHVVRACGSSPRRRAGPQGTSGEAFFHTIDSEPAAYWFGYLAGCGKIHEQDGRPVIDLEVPCEDLDHVAKFRSTIGSNATVEPIRIDDEPDEEPVYLWQLRLTSPQMVADLARHGLADTSPQEIGWPPLPEHLLQHFLRGLSDGSSLDGLIVDRNRPPSFCISANAAFLTVCERFLVQACRFDRTSHIARVELRFTQPHDVVAIARLLYAGATISLPSKREAVQQRILAAPEPER